MALVIDQWCRFLAAVVIATLAMSSGVGAAILFSPLFMVVLDLGMATVFCTLGLFRLV